MRRQKRNLLDEFFTVVDFEFHYFEEMSTWDIFTSASFVTIGTLGILLNLRALMVVLTNKRLSRNIKFYLLADHLFRIISAAILFYPAACSVIRMPQAPTMFEEYGFESSPEFMASNRTLTPLCFAWWWYTIWGGEANQVLALAFNTILHFLELLQLAVSVNRWLAVAFGGRYHHVLGRTVHLQVDLIISATWIAFYKFSYGGYMYFDDFSFSLVSTEYLGYTELNAQVLKAIRILSLLVTLISILLDWSTFVLLRRHLENSRKLTQSDEKNGADLRLAKQLLFNHAYAIFVSVCSCYILVIFTQIESMSRDITVTLPLLRENEQMMKTSWMIFLASSFFPGLGTVINGLMAIIFLSPAKEKTSITTSKRILVTSAQDARPAVKQD